MHIAALSILAFLAGIIFNFFKPKVDSMIPDNLKSGFVVPSLITGAYLLAVIALASLVMSFFPSKLHAKIPGVK